MSTFFQDLRYALRGLRKSPGYTVAAVLVLALGIGANTAVFSVINAVLLRPLPYPNSEQLVTVRCRTSTFPSASVSLPDFLDWRAAQHSCTDLTLSRRESVNLSFSPGSGVPPERVSGTTATANYLTVLGVQPALGRNFVEAEDTPGGPLAVIISDHLWRLRCAANPHVLGERLVVDGESREIVGVLPATLNSTRGVEVVVPFGNLRVQPNIIRRDNHPGFTAIGRLRPGVTLAAATREFTALAAELERRYPDSNKGWSVDLHTLLDNTVGSYRQSLYLLLGAVGCVLLIACANVANLQLARATGRTKELAVRAALGATRARLVRQTLTESVLVSVLGGATGVLLALWAVDAILRLAPAASPRFGEARLDLAALGFTALVALGTGVVAGAWPAWRVTRLAAMASALHESGARGSSGGASQHRARAVLVVAQVALAVVLLTGAGLTLESFWRMYHEPLGFQSGGLLTMSVSLPAARYPFGDPMKKSLFYSRLLEAVSGLPGVESAGLASNMPFGGSDWESSYHVTGTPADEPGKSPEVSVNSVSPHYFQTMGMPILRGRDFGVEDRVDRPSSVIIDEDFARHVFPGRDPVGQHLDDNQADDPKTAPPTTIVGVVRHVRNDAPGENPSVAALVQMYYCATQNGSANCSIIVRPAAGDPRRLAEPVRRALQSIDPELPVADVDTMEGTIDASLSAQRLTMVLLATFAALALVLASIGLYGVMSLGVTQRTRELGIRLALGAQRNALLGLVMRQGTALVGIGLGVGLLVALALGRALASILYGVTGSDPLTLGVVTLVLAGTALLACWMPARRAMRVDPMVALRDE